MRALSLSLSLYVPLSVCLCMSACLSVCLSVRLSSYHYLFVFACLLYLFFINKIICFCVFCVCFFLPFVFSFSFSSSLICLHKKVLLKLFVFGSCFRTLAIILFLRLLRMMTSELKPPFRAPPHLLQQQKNILKNGYDRRRQRVCRLSLEESNSRT